MVCKSYLGPNTYRIFLEPDVETLYQHVLFFKNNLDATPDLSDRQYYFVIQSFKGRGPRYKKRVHCVQRRNSLLARDSTRVC